MHSGETLAFNGKILVQNDDGLMFPNDTTQTIEGVRRIHLYHLDAVFLQHLDDVWNTILSQLPGCSYLCCYPINIRRSNYTVIRNRIGEIGVDA